MGLPKFFVLVLLFAHCIFAERVIRTTCYDKEGVEYVNCIKSSFEELIQLNSDGVPNKGFKSMDPMVIDHIEVVEDAVGMKSHFTNIKITGFKDVKVMDYKEEVTKKDHASITWDLKFDFVAEGPLRIEMLKKDHSLSGSVKYEGGVNTIIKYNSVTKRVDNELAFELGPEQITCQPHYARSTLSEELRTAIANDTDAQAGKDEYEKVKKEHQEKVVCEMAKALVYSVWENMRLLGRHPKLEK